jgi:hypothetical protein
MTNDDVYKNYCEQEERRRKLAAELRAATKAKLCDALQSSGIARVTVIFDGQSDSGQIEDIAAFDPADKPIRLPLRQLIVETAKRDGSGADTATVPLKDVIENLCYELLQEHHDGWEINEGSFGEFEFDIPNRSVALTFNGRITDFETSTHTY